MKKKQHNTARNAIVAMAIGATALSGCSSSGTPGTTSDASAPAAEGAGLERLTIVVPTSAGGGIDTAARQLQPYLEESLSTTIVVENREGGGTTIGTTHMLSNADDCSNIMITGIPHINLSYLTNEVDFELASFAPIGGISVEPGVIRVANDAPWQSLSELVDDARAEPGSVSFSVSEPVSANVLGLRNIEAAAGVDFNIVPYDGGGPSRLALESGEVDATHAGVFNSLGIAETTRVLAVHQEENRWPEETDNAPTVSDDLGVDAGVSEATYNLWTSATCAEQNPETYQSIVDALESAVSSEELRAELQEVGEQNKLDYRDPERVLSDAEEQEAAILELMAEDPALFTE